MGGGATPSERSDKLGVSRRRDAQRGERPKLGLGRLLHMRSRVEGGGVQGPVADLHDWSEHELIAMQDVEQTAVCVCVYVCACALVHLCGVFVCLCVWVANHTHRETSFKGKGLTNDFQGQEGGLISRIVRDMWWALGMQDIRRRLQVGADLAIDGLGDPRPEHVFQLIPSYEDTDATLGR